MINLQHTTAYVSLAVSLAISGQAYAKDTAGLSTEKPFLILDNASQADDAKLEMDYNDFNRSEQARFAELNELVKRRVFENQDRVDPLWQ